MNALGERDEADLSESDRERLEELAASDRKSAPIYQWYLERLDETEGDGDE